MRTSPHTYPIGKWQHVTRARQPYAFETITVVPDLPEPTLENADQLQATEQRFLLGPIHPHLFALEPGDADGFVSFVSQLGIMELLRWVGDTELRDHEAWRPLIGTYEVLGLRQLWIKHLEDAWTSEATARQYGHERRHLMDLFEETAQFEDPEAAAALVVEIGEPEAFRVEFRRHGKGQIYERPRNIFNRVWFEILEGLLERSLLPEICAYCRNPFEPTRSDQRHCPGTQCQPRHSDRKRRKDPWRMEYDKMRQRRKRRAITAEEFDKWSINNPRPQKRKED